MVVMFSAFVAFAQMPGGMQTGGAGITGRLYGRIVTMDNRPIADVTVMLMESKMDTVTKKNKDILLQAITSQPNGDFNFENVPLRGRLKLNISSTGYKAYTEAVSFFANGKPAPGAMPTLNKDLGNIKLAEDQKQLQAVTVTATAPEMRLNGEKKIFNVDKNIMSTGGTGVDVMRNVPSINVDIDGNIKLRNSAPQLLVDGRPTTLTLDQIPADAIESVEVITNPSAKYDASGGGGGILNIVLKKNKKTGYNGGFRAGVDKNGALNGGADISVRQDKINFTASISANQNKSISTGYSNRLNLSDVPKTSIFQDNYSESDGGFLFGKAGIDFLATNRTTYSLSGIKMHGSFGPDETIDIITDSLYSPTVITSLSNRTTTGSRNFDGQGLVLGLKHLFISPGEELTIDANYFAGKNSSNQVYTTNNLNADKSINNTELQNVIGSGVFKNYTLQTDYVKPLTKKTKLETGLSARLRNRDNINDNYFYNNGGYVIVPSDISDYSNKDNVYAAYATVTSKIKDFSYNLGLRAESFDYTGVLNKTGERFKKNYPVSLFPSAFLSKPLKNKQELQFSYSRRINRPNFFQLLPFTDYTDKLNITQGNPNLEPEFTQSFEFSYLKKFKGSNSFLSSVYYKKTDDLITRYLSQQDDPISGDPQLVNTYINANSSYSAGAELTSTNKLAKWWDISSNVNIYNSKVNTDNVSGTSQDAIWSWFGKFNSNFKLPADFTIQYTATYQSKSNLPVNSNSGMGGGPHMSQSQSSSQGFIKPSWGMDVAIKKTFLKNNAGSVTLSFTDIFKTRTNEQYSSSSFFTQTYSRLRDPQMIKLGLAYRFGKIDATLFKRKSNSSGMGGVETGM